jgi:enoyl-CoA hydratase/carnithine racemase
MLALCCDYRVMTDGSKRKAWMCMNEVRSLGAIKGRGVQTSYLGTFWGELATFIRLYCSGEDYRCSGSA